MSWINDLKVGDEVFAFFSGKGTDIYKIERITPKYIVVNGVKFLRESGKIEPLKLNNYDKYSCLAKLTVEKKEEFIIKKKLSFIQHELNSFNATKIPTDKLLAIYDLLKPEEK